MKKVLITGANGYIAHHLKILLQQPYWSLDLMGEADLQACISDIDRFQTELKEVEIVFHLADQKLQDLNDKNLAENIYRHQQFIEHLEKLQSLKAFIFCSSCSVYGTSKGVITENSPTHLTSAYAKSKFETEKLIQNSALPWRIVRFATAYGLSQPMRYDLIINDLVLALKDNIKREVYGLDASRPYIHCKDFARALLDAVDWPEKSLKNMVESNWSKREILGFIQKISNIDLPLIIDDSRVDMRNYHAKLTHNFPFEYPFQKGLQELIDAHLS